MIIYIPDLHNTNHTNNSVTDVFCPSKPKEHADPIPINPDLFYGLDINQISVGK